MQLYFPITTSSLLNQLPKDQSLILSPAADESTPEFECAQKNVNLMLNPVPNCPPAIPQCPGRTAELSVRRREATSSARTVGFNKVVVNKFFDALEKIVDQEQITASRIFNMDDTLHNSLDAIDSPEIRLTVEPIASLVGAGFPRAASMETAINGFRKTGMWPVIRHVFIEADLAAAPVTENVHSKTQESRSKNNKLPLAMFL
ncbi:hypothetical protein PR048_032822 [Dryococelus australis]|uniref:Uncharacterized protein n=1 Tax=Dryococelus australis TaxID=614101 RepID=A0ABQ9G3A4_9NEOP|nr:hypothetical protein PR048_032822 [Dryococelus australis]